MATCSKAKKPYARCRQTAACRALGTESDPLAARNIGCQKSAWNPTEIAKGTRKAAVGSSSGCQGIARVQL